MKTCLIIRYGAYGDAVMLTCVLPYLYKQGYEITANVNKRTHEVLRNNPYIKKYIIHEDDSVPTEDLPKHWGKMSEGYDKVINFTGIIENDLMFSYPQPEYYWCLAKRRKHVSHVNYLERHFEKAEIVPDKIKTEIYFSRRERKKALKYRRKHKNHFLILWALCGSSINKVYKYWEYVSNEFLEQHRNAFILAIGDELTKFLHYPHPRIEYILPSNYSFRHSMTLVPLVDLVIGPETGILNVAGCFDTPKICMLTHSSQSNLTKHWINDYSIQSMSYCSPCHLIHRFKTIWRNVCQVDPETGFPECCTVGFPTDIILETMNTIYNKWRKHEKRKPKRKRKQKTTCIPAFSANYGNKGRQRHEISSPGRA